ncbi:class I SAM-dependent methyltransferase [Janthinobacterium sp.]|uniref:class I SAM-dependent methyltransferase n=1 Tax=Janthinobacterium sp. TaxID=1871054 RepID=UPI00293D3E4D|nr:class I SAM-dependent methyltransferase [Janthinobacterium sp.]
MGIDAQGLNCLRYAKTFGDFGRTLTLGRQCVHLHEKYISQKIGHKYQHKFADYCEPFLQNFFGATSIDSLDATTYEHATILHDLNLPFDRIPPQFDTVIDFGTLEHVFNLPQALSTLWNLTAEGGQILHCLPANNFCGHGFWQFSPELFFSMYRPENGFESTEIFLARTGKSDTWYRVNAPTGGKRVNIRTLGEIYVIVRTVIKTRPVSAFAVQQSDYLDLWSTEAPPLLQSKFAFVKTLFTKSGFNSALHQAYWRMTRFHPSLHQVNVAQLVNDRIAKIKQSPEKNQS